MQRKRGELVPIGEALADLDGTVKELREASPQALGHFTLSDQVNQLAWASEADADLGQTHHKPVELSDHPEAATQVLWSWYR